MSPMPAACAAADRSKYSYRFPSTSRVRRAFRLSWPVTLTGVLLFGCAIGAGRRVRYSARPPTQERRCRRLPVGSAHCETVSAGLGQLQSAVQGAAYEVVAEGIFPGAVQRTG